MKIKFKKLHEDARLPIYKNDGDAGFDLYTVEDIQLTKGEIKSVKLGFATEIPKGYYVAIVPRSGLALNDGITVLNTPGTVDETYRNEWKVILYKPYIQTSPDINAFPKGTRIAQGILKKYEKAEFIEVDELSDSTRIGGFGSTGKN